MFEKDLKEMLENLNVFFKMSNNKPYADDEELSAIYNYLVDLPFYKKALNELNILNYNDLDKYIN